MGFNWKWKWRRWRRLVLNIEKLLIQSQGQKKPQAIKSIQSNQMCLLKEIFIAESWFLLIFNLKISFYDNFYSLVSHLDSNWILTTKRRKKKTMKNTFFTDLRRAMEIRKWKRLFFKYSNFYLAINYLDFHPEIQFAYMKLSRMAFACITKWYFIPDT
jgi:hypothetical protein